MRALRKRIEPLYELKWGRTHSESQSLAHAGCILIEVSLKSFLACVFKHNGESLELPNFRFLIVRYTCETCEHRLPTLTINFRSICRRRICMWVIISIGLVFVAVAPFRSPVVCLFFFFLLNYHYTKGRRKNIFSILDQMFFVVSMIVLRTTSQQRSHTFIFTPKETLVKIC